MKSLNELYSKTADFIIKNDNYLIIAHDRPDGDTIGSVLGLALFLKKLKKSVYMVCKSPVPAVFGFLKGSEEFHEDFLFGDYHSIILVDNGDLKRTGFDTRLKEYKRLGKPIVNIDHHPQNDIWKISTINLVDQKVSSSAEIVFNLLNKINPQIISPKIATAILAGIYTDTGGFQHATTGSETLKLSAKLMSLGGHLKDISENLSGQKPYQILKLWGIALKCLKLNRKLGIVISIIPQADIKEIGCSEEDLAGVVNLINSTSDAKSAMLLYETKDGNIKGSLRTENENIDLSKLASLLGGGGHKKAAGFSFQGRLVKKDGRIRVE